MLHVFRQAALPRTTKLYAVQSTPLLSLSPACPKWEKNLVSPLNYALAAAMCIVLESLTACDNAFQMLFFHQGSWSLPKVFHNEWKTLLYTTPKIMIGVIFLLALLLSLRTAQKHHLAWKAPAAVAALSLLCIPLCVALLKALTGVHGPESLLPYGGSFPHIGVLEQLWLYGHTASGRGFPAGHASGGFALMALCYLPVSAVWKKILFFVGFSAGWLMGLYQMARGEHFLSHTLTTMFLALCIMTCLAKRFRL